MSYEFIRHTPDSSWIERYSGFLSAPYVASGKYVNIGRATPEYLKWQYVDNPEGAALGYSALFRSEIVGHFSALPLTARVLGRELKGLLALNLVTHPEHRGKGLFIKMAGKTFEDAASLGYKFVIGVANRNSTHGLVNRLGFSLLSQLKAKVGLGNIDLNSSDDYEFKTVWRADTLKWRISNPSATYYLNRGNHIIRYTGKYGIYAQIKHVDESEKQYVTLPETRKTARLWIGLARETGRGRPYIGIPRIIRPAPLNLIFLTLSGEVEKPDSNSLFFELIDFDIY